MESPLSLVDILFKGCQIVIGLLALLPLKAQWKLVFVPLALALAGPYLLPAFEGIRTGNPYSEEVQKLQLEHWSVSALAIWIALLATVQSHTLFVLAVEPLKDWVSPERFWKQTVTGVIMEIVFVTSLYAYCFFYSSRTSVPVCQISLIVLLGLVLALGLPLADGFLALFSYQGGLSRVLAIAFGVGLNSTVLALLVVRIFPQYEVWLTRMILTSAITWVVLESGRFAFAAYYASNPTSAAEPIQSTLIATVAERNICDVCNREFPTRHGLAIHRGRIHRVAASPAPVPPEVPVP